MKTLFLRELHGYFATPVGYVFLAMYTLLSGIVFVFVNIGQEMSASMNVMLSAMHLPFLLIAPLLTMRLFAEERRMRTDQLLFTLPVRTGAIVFGKFLAACVMLLIAMLLTGLYTLVISRFAQISVLETLCTYLGYYLLGTSLLSVGLLISSLCFNQMTAGVLTLGINVFLYLNEHYIQPQLTNRPWNVLGSLLSALPGQDRLGDFANGILSLSDLVYYLVFSFLMLFLTTRLLEARKHQRRRAG